MPRNSRQCLIIFLPYIYIYIYIYFSHNICSMFWQWNHFRYISIALKVVVITIQNSPVVYKYLNFILSISVLWLLALSSNWCSYILLWFFFQFKEKITNNHNHKRILLFKLSLKVPHPSRYWWVFTRNRKRN